MLLSELEGMPFRYYIHRVYTLLWDIANGAYPSIDLFNDKEIDTLMKGEDLEDVKSPFWKFSPNMKVEPLPLMELTTTKDVFARRRQMKILSFFTTVNKMLRILSLEVQHIEEEVIAVSLY